MSFSDDQPLTRRAARDAARATGEQAVLPTSGSAPIVVSEPEALFVEPTPTGIIGLDGQLLTRRRLRELREQSVDPVVQETTATAAAEPPVAFPTPPAPISGSIFAPPVAPVPTPTPPLEVVRPESGPEAATETEPAPTQEPVTKPEWTAPEGHWTRQLAAIDEEDLLETTLSREVGGSNPTTSALIIQDAPASMDLGGPLDSTGEILLTGSIPLSPSLATTGSVERLRDADADLDDHFDDRRLHDTAQDAQPVRASAVASQHALGTPIVSDGRSRGNRGLTVLLIVASSLAVVVTGLVVAAIALKWI